MSSKTTEVVGGFSHTFDWLAANPVTASDRLIVRLSDQCGVVRLCQDMCWWFSHTSLIGCQPTQPPARPSQTIGQSTTRY